MKVAKIAFEIILNIQVYISPYGILFQVSKLQLNRANSSNTEAPFLDLNLLYLMVQFPPKFIINGTILILI